MTFQAIPIAIGVAIGLAISITIVLFRKKSGLKAGGYYSILDSRQGFRVVKILTVDNEAVHVSLFTNRFPARPTDVDPSTLTLEMNVDDLDDDEGDLSLGIAHLPIDRDGFMESKPIFLRLKGSGGDQRFRNLS